MAGQLRIGLLTHTQAEQRILRGLVAECGHQAGSCLLVQELEHHPEFALDDPGLIADAWVVAIETESDDDAGGEEADSIDVEHWLDQQDNLEGGSAAVIFCDGVVPAPHDARYLAWARRLKEKLNQLEGAINLARGAGSARQVWVLAASTGGPGAVKQFLDELPGGLGVGFVYVQHIDGEFNSTLAQAISRGNHYPAELVRHGSVVRPNEVAIVSPDVATELLPNGTFVVHQRPWSAPYRPSADYTVANVAHSYGARSGVIVFSGMGDDGAASSRLMRQKGGRVWIQTPASCTSDSMPQAALKAGAVQFQGEPRELAQRLRLIVEREARRPDSKGELPLESING
ncbi:chemotaxis protein CheB [Gilvimarinus sp. F26214L]|uniref:chemotaxis protein CheB n=1 Tax=Gilvimarinus sp. DZF01 TaxID=3461371 RepID=UPI0040453681